MNISFSVDDLIRLIPEGVTISGTYDGRIRSISSLQEAEEGDLSFLGNMKYRSQVDASKASIILVPLEFPRIERPRQMYLHVDNPTYALAQICDEIERAVKPKAIPGIHPSACIDETASIDPKATSGPFVVVEADARIGASVIGSHSVIRKGAIIGDDTEISSHVTVETFSEVGHHCRVYAGVVIGADGYGYDYADGYHKRLPQIGRVVIEDRVDLGANTTIDRARFGVTRIGTGTKIDNQVQIGHNVTIGKHCLIVAQVGIGGSSSLGDGVVVGGQAGIIGHIQVGAGAQCAAGSKVTNTVKPGEKMRGNPAIPMMLCNRIAVLQRKLPDLFKRFAQLEEKLDAHLKS